MTARKQRAGNQNPDLGNQFAPGKQFYDVGEARRGEHTIAVGRQRERKREREEVEGRDEKGDVYFSCSGEYFLKKHETKEKC